MQSKNNYSVTILNPISSQLDKLRTRAASLRDSENFPWANHEKKLLIKGLPEGVILKDPNTMQVDQLRLLHSCLKQIEFHPLQHDYSVDIDRRKRQRIQSTNENINEGMELQNANLIFDNVLENDDSASSIRPCIKRRNQCHEIGLINNILCEEIIRYPLGRSQSSHITFILH